MNALNALGLDYDDSDDSASEAPAENAAAAVPAGPTEGAPIALPPVAAAALPDAGALLGDMPDEVDWDARAPSPENAPTYDAKGTAYNNVALPASMAADANRQNYKAEKRSRPPYGLGDAAAAAAAAVTAGSSTAAPVPSKPAGGRGRTAQRPAARSSGGVMMPPQLAGRRNVTTEDVPSYNSSSTKRPKP